MSPSFARSTVFNIAFYIVTTALAILYIPALLFPRKIFIILIRFWLQIIALLERLILNLHYKLEGTEHLPKEACIIAAKHQSAYETLKLHLILDDPAIVLKKALLWIPLFGAYLMKSGAIAIDRSTPEKALRSVQKGALRVKAENRPIVIFPQGTRVNVNTTPEEKPYKPGIVRVQDVTQLPIIPMALNSGFFWPRNAWLKTPGIVTFKFLAPISPGKDRQTLMQALENILENESNALTSETRLSRLEPQKRSYALKVITFTALCLGGFSAYAAWWKNVAINLQTNYNNFHNELGDFNPDIMPVSGFPGAMKIIIPEEKIQTSDGTITIKNLYLRGYPFPHFPITLSSGEITITSYKWAAPVTLDSLQGVVAYGNNRIKIKESILKQKDFNAFATGDVLFLDGEMPRLDLMLRFKNHQGFIDNLAQGGILDQRTARFMNAGFSALADETGYASIPVSQRGRTLYAGPFAFAELPQFKN